VSSITQQYSAFPRMTERVNPSAMSIYKGKSPIRGQQPASLLYSSFSPAGAPGSATTSFGQHPHPATPTPWRPFGMPSLPESEQEDDGLFKDCCTPLSHHHHQILTRLTGISKDNSDYS
jgi:hypothetical protein